MTEKPALVIEPTDFAYPVDRVRDCIRCDHPFYTTVTMTECGTCQPAWWEKYHEQRAKIFGGEHMKE